MNDHFANNLGLLERGLTQYRTATFDGVEFPLYSTNKSTVPRVDILALDARGGCVVIECKLLNALHVVVGQVASYVALLREHFLPAGTKVRAFIVCRDASPLLWYALREIHDIEFAVFAYDCPYGLPELATVRELASPLGLRQPQFDL